MEEDYGIDAGASGQGRRESRLIIELQDISRICMDMSQSGIDSGYVKGLIQGQAARGEGTADKGAEHGELCSAPAPDPAQNTAGVCGVWRKAAGFSRRGVLLDTGDIRRTRKPGMDMNCHTTR
jgi:hypothetical protein